ncbi:YybH family protein [Kineobactrum salinum]|uniref:Nuclear transport factor 2 family protein n=1 Tax=Kineobactrum salinum TaxID=2708301 RepID=A0A6C0U6J1_9GAMM|nr:nuclear transport factor 2 family protein [Kineobactrum salinum]QIB65064.1 nuclear transport factor 2 family protein [Kineobactrum salinum]
MPRDKESESEIERIERTFNDPNFNLEECYQYIDPDDFVAFRFMPPTVVGREEWKRIIGEMAENVARVDGEIIKMEISAGSDHGFANSILKVTTYDEDGNATFSGNLRTTVCYRKKDDKWFQVAQHASVPINFATGQPDFDSEW